MRTLQETYKSGQSTEYPLFYLFPVAFVACTSSLAILLAKASLGRQVPPLFSTAPH